MTALDKIAYFQNRRDETPNKELAAELVRNHDLPGIQEIAENLWNEDDHIQKDCLVVLYWVGYQQPELIAQYAEDFLQLLESRDNRLVWSGMIALSTVAHLRADLLYEHIDEIRRVMGKGSVITVDNAVKTLAIVASTSPERRQAIFPELLDHLATCRAQSVAQHAEHTLVAVDASNREDFVRVLEKRLDDLRGGQVGRVRRILRKVETL